MCKEDDMLDFPRRMRDWLFNIMRDLADRQELPSHFLKMQREAETNMTLRWTNAAIWKWCDLDGHPHDRSVSRHELFPIRAPLMALEHCIAPFLDGCDVNSDHKITLTEWGKCLELDEVQSLFSLNFLIKQTIYYLYLFLFRTTSRINVTNWRKQHMNNKIFKIFFSPVVK